MKKRILSILLALCLLLSMLSVTAYAEDNILSEGACGANLKYTLTRDGVLTIQGTGDMFDYTHDHYGYHVLMHGVYRETPWGTWYNEDADTKIREVYIAEGVTSIGNYAFWGNLYRFETIHLPDSLKKIGSSAFDGCSNLTSINIPNSVTSIGLNAFSGCSNLTSINIPDGVTSIEVGTFSGCSNLTSINIPDSVTSIWAYAFSGCSNLININIPNSVTSIGGHAFYGCSNLININIPNSVTSILDGVFYGCSNLTSINIPDNVTSIGSNAFRDCSSLTSINIPDNVTSIGGYAFYGCYSLISAYFMGNAPLGFEGSVFDDCADSFTIYYKVGMSGWTDNSAYNPEKGTWHGYKLELWDGGGEDYDTVSYSHFGKFDSSTKSSAVIDGVEYQFTEEFEKSSNNLPYLQSGNYIDNYVYAMYNLDAENKITALKWTIGNLCTLEDWDAANYIVDTDLPAILPPEGAELKSGDFRVSEITRDSFPTDKIADCIGDDVRVYTDGQEIYKIIHVEYGSGIITAFDALSAPQKVYIDDVAHVIAENDPKLVKRCQENLFEKVIYTLYDDTVVDCVSYYGLSVGINEGLFTYTKNSSNEITSIQQSFTFEISNNISSDFYGDIELLKSVEELDVKIISISSELTVDSPISFSDETYEGEVLHIGESIEKFGCTLSLDQSAKCESATTHLKLTVEAMLDGEIIICTDERDVTISGIGTKLPDPKPEDDPKPDNESTSESNGNNSLDNLIKELEDDLKLEKTIAWDSVFANEFLTSQQKEQIGYALLSNVVVASLPSTTFEDYVAQKVLKQFLQVQTTSILGITELNFAIEVRIDTKKYGNLIFEFSYEGVAFFNNGNLFGTSPEPIKYKIISQNNNIPNDKLSGMAGMLVYANMNKFTDGVTKLLKSQFIDVLGTGAKEIKDLTQLKEIAYGDTVINVLKAVLKTKDPKSLIKKAGWEIMTYPMKLIKIKCPVDVYVYDENNTICASVKNNIGESFNENIIVDVIGSSKYFTILNGKEYRFDIKPTANGTMDIIVEELSGYNRVMRTLEYYDLPLEIGTPYNGITDFEFLTDKPFNLAYDGNVIIPDKDISHTSSLIDPSDDLDHDNTSSNFDYDYWMRTLMQLRNQEFTITATANEGGKITPSGSTKVKYDMTQKYTIIPDSGYKISDVLVDGKSVGAVDVYRFNNVKKNHTIKVEFSKIAWENPFVDVSENDWFYEDVKFVDKKGLMNGNNAEGTIFAPNVIVNRAMLVTILWRLEGNPAVDYNADFTDVPANEWYTNAINWAASIGLVNGYGDGRFGPTNELTHEQIAAILNRYVLYKDIDDGITLPIIPRYQYSAWAENSVIWANYIGLFDNIGVDISDLTKAATRSEIAAYLRRFCDLFTTN